MKKGKFIGLESHRRIRCSEEAVTKEKTEFFIKDIWRFLS